MSVVLVCAISGCLFLVQLQVSNLSDDVSRKLDYLHVSREKITDLQKLQIQLEVSK